MANAYEPKPEDEASWLAWVAQLPEHMREAVGAVRPWRLYRLGSTGQRVTLGGSISEDLTCEVNVTGEFNLVTVERRVFGVALHELVECDLPPAGEPSGAMLTDPEDIQTFVEENRERILAARPKPN